MSVYHSSFSYLGINSSIDKKWIITHFDPDSGETDSYLSKDQIYSDSYDGTKRILYGTRWNSVATPSITVIKQDGSEFSLAEIRAAYKWLTGNTSSSWMDFYIGDELTYRLLCTIQDVKPYKMDARTIGLTIICESLSPWAYSPLQAGSQSIAGEETISINNESDDLYTYTYLNVVYENTSGDSLKIINNTLKEETTEVTSLAINEKITISDGMTIVSDKTGKVFGNSFNFIFPRLKAGENKLTIIGTGNISYEYIYCIKMSDMAIDINSASDPICDPENGDITIDTLHWSRITNTPTTLSGYGIQDAYTKDEIDTKLKEINSQPGGSSSGENVDLTDYYTKDEIDEKFDNLTIPETVELSWNNITDKPTTLEEYGLKEEVNTLLSSIAISIDEEELNAMLGEVLA